MPDQATTRAVEGRAALVAPLFARMFDRSDGAYVPFPDEDDPESFSGQLLRAIYGEHYRERRGCLTSPSITPTFPAS